MAWIKCKSYSGSVSSGQDLIVVLNTKNSTKFRVLGFSIITDSQTVITLNNDSNVMTMGTSGNYAVNIDVGMNFMADDGNLINITKMIFGSNTNILSMNYFYSD